MVKKIITILLYVTVTNLVLSQNKLQLHVLDSETNEGIPFCDVLYGVNKGTITNDDGTLSLNLDFYPDSIVIYNLAYETKTVKVNKSQSEYYIKLQPKKFYLNEVEVVAKRGKSIKLGIYKNKWYAGPNYERGTNVSLFIDNKNANKGYIKNLQYYMCKKNTLNPTNIFRVHIYAVDSITKGPGKELLSENVFANAKEGDEWVVVDVLKYNIEYPPEGFFIGYEVLSNHREDEGVLIENRYMESHNAVLAASEEKTNQRLTWIKYPGREKWRKGTLPPTCKNCVNLNAKMACEIIIEK
ncbi:MAG: hypothetical protein LBQ22_13055 [Bacteroidales bacterium]|jgi:hypothetical protein|nr:hypothetical protein [Bacteroidales bacterium]